MPYTAPPLEELFGEHARFDESRKVPLKQKRIAYDADTEIAFEIDYRRTSQVAWEEQRRGRGRHTARGVVAGERASQPRLPRLPRPCWHELTSRCPRRRQATH